MWGQWWMPWGIDSVNGCGNLCCHYCSLLLGGCHSLALEFVLHSTCAVGPRFYIITQAMRVWTSKGTCWLSKVQDPCPLYYIDMVCESAIVCCKRLGTVVHDQASGVQEPLGAWGSGAKTWAERDVLGVIARPKGGFIVKEQGCLRWRKGVSN